MLTTARPIPSTPMRASVVTSRCMRTLSTILSPLQNRKQHHYWSSQPIFFVHFSLSVYVCSVRSLFCWSQQLSAKSLSLFCRAWFQEEVEAIGHKKCEFKVLRNEITNNNSNRLCSCFARRTLPSVTSFPLSSFSFLVFV